MRVLVLRARVARSLDIAKARGGENLAANARRL
jgi:hypothetical protein